MEDSLHHCVRRVFLGLIAVVAVLALGNLLGDRELVALPDDHEDHHGHHLGEGEDGTTPPELAEYMSTLQVYTHKLSLSIDANNTELAAFYMWESLALLEEIQMTFSQYETVPVALYIDRHGLDGYKPLKALLREESPDPVELSHAMDGIINGCNACHVVSKFEFLKIERNPHNPYLQSFERN